MEVVGCGEEFLVFLPIGGGIFRVNRIDEIYPLDFLRRKRSRVGVTLPRHERAVGNLPAVNHRLFRLAGHFVVFFDIHRRLRVLVEISEETGRAKRNRYIYCVAGMHVEFRYPPLIIHEGGRDARAGYIFLIGRCRNRDHLRQIRLQLRGDDLVARHNQVMHGPPALAFPRPIEVRYPVHGLLNAVVAHILVAT